MQAWGWLIGVAHRNGGERGLYACDKLGDITTDELDRIIETDRDLAVWIGMAAPVEQVAYLILQLKKLGDPNVEDLYLNRTAAWFADLEREFARLKRTG